MDDMNQPEMKIDIELMSKPATRGPRKNAMGDFNPHNLLWSDPSLLTPSPDTAAGRLLAHEMTTKANMPLLIKQDNPWDNSDHRPIKTVLGITPYRDDTDTFLHNKVKPVVFAAVLKENLPCMKEMAFETEGGVKKSHHLTLISQNTPTRLVNPPQSREPMDPHLRHILLGGGVGLNVPASELDFRPPLKKPTRRRGYLQQTGESKDAF
ncbi:hypothetical protein FANTH_8077 [Fusarium anthophilum]|uniref:Uncharacterized protein n=1 Tax=Fusarium anthophilum TaxID=48485 RepID=A0A8H4ZD47_9HYPO|nr:hypothetical protein FANTH_8077 [Fusarium anthophilum]